MYLIIFVAVGRSRSFLVSLCCHFNSFVLISTAMRMSVAEASMQWSLFVTTAFAPKTYINIVLMKCVLILNKLSYLCFMVAGTSASLAPLLGRWCRLWGYWCTDQAGRDCIWNHDASCATFVRSWRLQPIWDCFVFWYGANGYNHCKTLQSLWVCKCTSSTHVLQDSEHCKLCNFQWLQSL